jgi:hypothetical protein
MYIGKQEMEARNCSRTDVAYESIRFAMASAPGRLRATTTEPHGICRIESKCRATRWFSSTSVLRTDAQPTSVAGDVVRKVPQRELAQQVVVG